MSGIFGMSPTVGAYLYQLPLYAVWITGVVLCMKRWQRHPKVCAVAMVAFSLLFLESLVGTLFTYSLLPQMLKGSQGNRMGIVRTIIHAGLWGLVIVAVFGWRNPVRSGRADRSEHLDD